jgi:hypothetical protein
VPTQRTICRSSNTVGERSTDVNPELWSVNRLIVVRKDLLDCLAPLAPRGRSLLSGFCDASYTPLPPGEVGPQVRVRGCGIYSSYLASCESAPTRDATNPHPEQSSDLSQRERLNTHGSKRAPFTRRIARHKLDAIWSAGTCVRRELRESSDLAPPSPSCPTA